VTDEAGVLYVVATPIGNLGDMTERALTVLRQVDLIAAEDTRKAHRLLSHFGIQAELRSYHEHNEASSVRTLLAVLEDGRDLALISDAGTPLISDPGFVLVRAARQNGLRVVPIPGANAAICALSTAGLPSDRFLFLGFPPRTSSKCREWLAGVAGEPGTLLMYESGKRAGRTLVDLAAVLGGARQAVIGRELTKRFETFLIGTLDELSERLETDAEQRLGELVLLVEGATKGANEAQTWEEDRVLGILAGEMPLKQAAALAARITGGSKNRLYQVGLGLDRFSEVRPMIDKSPPDSDES
jgi:16S rRNA (cytidine1402-2'-O)-methyltransferase